jgi:Protein of unknown function (DUF3300)
MFIMLTLTRWFISLIFLTGLVPALAVEIKPAPAQSAYTPLDDRQLEELLGPVALYPDDLLAIVLPASTFPLQIVQAARFRTRTPDAKPDEKWDDSVVALLNYPEVLKKLNDDLDWTWRLGEAVINQQPQVLAAITAFRNRAQLAGNLKSDDKQVVEVREKIVYIRPANERVIYVPYYDPWEVTTYRTRRVYHYYPEPCPVYYYPYDYGYRFPGGTFWGVSTWYNIGWSNHHLRSLPYDYRHHPYYGRSYRDRDRRRSWRHQEHGSRLGNAPEPQVTNGQPVLPDDTAWYPREGHGARPVDGRPQEIASPIGTPPPAPLGSQIGGQVPGGGGESAVSIPEQPTVITDTTGEAVVYEGNVNGEQVRVIRRGTNFETQRGNDTGTIVSDAPAPVPAPISESTPDSGTVNDVTIQEAVERARQQATEQQAYSRSEPTVDATPSWRDEQPVVRVSPEPQVIDNEAINRAVQEARERAESSARFEPQVEASEQRRVEVYSAPAATERPSGRQAEEVQERQSRWEDNPAVQEAISRARDYGGYGNQSQREESRESRWEAPQREERSEPAYEAPMREERSEPAYEAPAPEERYEAPTGEPEIRY